MLCSFGGKLFGRPVLKVNAEFIKWNNSLFQHCPIEATQVKMRPKLNFRFYSEPLYFKSTRIIGGKLPRQYGYAVNIVVCCVC